jgi:hypothetical protein
VPFSLANVGVESAGWRNRGRCSVPMVSPTVREDSKDDRDDDDVAEVKPRVVVVVVVVVVWLTVAEELVEEAAEVAVVRRSLRDGGGDAGPVDSVDEADGDGDGDTAFIVMDGRT